MSGASSYFSWTIGLLTLVLAGSFSGCAISAHQHASSDRVMVPTVGTRGMSCCAMAKAVPRQAALAKTAVRFVGQSRVQIGGRNYNSDCSGFVRGVYASQRVDLYSGLGKLDGGNGVGRIYTHVVEHGRIHYGPTVHPGDLVFFHNTWDFNGDGIPNDPLTHIGVVEKVEPDGTVLFVSSLSRGIERYRMNLQHPDIHKTADGRVFNDFLRRKRFSDGMGTHYLAGQLFAAFGTLSH
jgi:probable lipoprotein NlpC